MLAVTSMNAVAAANQVKIVSPLPGRPGSCQRSAWAFFRLTAVWFLFMAAAAGDAFAATDVKVTFTLNTTDADGDPLVENRYYWIYRPDNLPKTTPVPMILCMSSGGDDPMTFFHRMADQAGFVLVSCSFSGNSAGGSWNNGDPTIDGFEDMDYATAVIGRVTQSDNCNDAFMCGLSKGGHMAYAYVCARPDKLKAACSVDEFMGLASNIPTAPVPILAIHGTADTAVPYTMGKDSADAWRTLDGLLNATAITTYEASPLLSGKVTQATWRGGAGGTQVAFVTIIGGVHEYALPTSRTGYDCTAGMWAFFSQFLTSAQAVPKIVSQPVNNIQLSGQPASFWVAATGNAPLAYQWQKNGTNLPGATVNWFTTPATTLADNGSTFRAVVTNSSGSVTSAVTTLTVNAAPADPMITSLPATLTVTAGQPFNVSIAAAGTAPLHYQWKKNGMDLVGATSASYSNSAAITPDCGAVYSVVVSNSAGSVTNSAASLTVLAASGAPILITNPGRSRVLTNQMGSFSVTAWSKTPMSYQWQKGTFTTAMVNIPGATNATYTTPLTTLSDHLTLFRCVVTNPAGNATSACEMLFVTSTATAPTGFASPLTAFAQAGVPFSYTVVPDSGTWPITFSASPLPNGLSLVPSTGVISGTPAAAGTTQVALGASNTAGSAPARTLVLTVTLTPPVIPIALWRSGHFGASAYNPDIAGDGADPDGDGVRNILEYATGTDPLAADLPSWLSYGLENGFLTASAARNLQATNVTWSAEASADLKVWNTTDTTLLQDTASLFKVRDNFAVATNPCRFLRLKISEP